MKGGFFYLVVAILIEVRVIFWIIFNRSTPKSFQAHSAGSFKPVISNKSL